MAMRLGKETASVVNYVMSGTAGAPEPAVGMGATILMWSDRHAATIVKVTPCTVTVKRDKARVVKGSAADGTAVYEFTPDPDAEPKVFRKTKKGWRETGGGAALRVGDRDEYHDPSF